MLDATPAGREVYRQEGFRDTWTFKRFHLPHPVPTDRGHGARPIANWQKLLQLDAAAFGANRAVLLRALQQRLPQSALASEAQGFVLGREGREARQIGPLVARDESTAMALLQSALAAVAAPLYVDVVDHAAQLQQWLLARGFVFQRPFTRMVHGADRAPGNEKLVYLVEGPELG